MVNRCIFAYSIHFYLRRCHMNICICEDEKAFADRLYQTLKRLLSDRVKDLHVKHFPSGNSFMKNLSEAKTFDLLFMDLQLPDADGVALVKGLRDNGCRIPVIFLTGLEDRIVEGYDVNAFHYLFKRNFEEKLPAVLDRFLKEIYLCSEISIKSKGSVTLLSPSDIYYIDAAKRNTAVHTASEIFTEAASIQTFAEELPPEFFIEVYHALYVNVDHVTKIDADSLTLDNNETVPVSRRKRKELMSAIMKRVHV